MMAFLKIFCYMFFAYGLSNMVVYARGPFGLFEEWRAFAHRISEGLGELFSCMICFPTWVGIAASVTDILFNGFAFTPFNVLLGGAAPWWLVVILDACLTSGLVWVVDQFETACERHGNFEYIEEEQRDNG